MKTLKLSAMIMVLALSFTSCKKGGLFCYKQNGDVITEVRSHENFSEIKLSTIGDVHIVQAEEYSVEIKASENIMNIIETEVNGSVLKIKLKKNKCIKGNTKVDIYVSMPDVKKLTVSGSGEIDAIGLIETTHLDLSVSGSGIIDLDNLSAEHVDMQVSGSGDIFIDNEDTTANQTIKISGSGSIQTINMLAKRTDIKISGSGDCRVHTTEELDVKISGSGSVIYKGNPLINSKITGSGSVKKY